MQRSRSFITAWAVIMVVTTPAVVRAWDFEFYGDYTFQDRVANVPLDYSIGGGYANFESSPGGDNWDTETVVAGGGAWVPIGDVKYLDRYDSTPVTGSKFWGANVAQVHGWTGPDWLEGPGYSTKKFTVVFRIKNRGSGKWSTDPVPVWQPKASCIFEIGSEKCCGNVGSPKDYLFAIATESRGASMDDGITWIFNWGDKQGSNYERNNEGPLYERPAEDNFEVYRLTGEVRWHAGYNRECLYLQLYKDEMPTPVWPAQGYKFNEDAGNGIAFDDIKFRFPKPQFADRLYRYDIDWMVIEVGHAWRPGDGDQIPLPEPEGYKRTFTIDPNQTRVAVTVNTPRGSDRDITSATGDVSVYLNPEVAPTTILLDRANLDFSRNLNGLVDDYGQGTLTVTATDMTLDHKMWWLFAGSSPLTVDQGRWSFVWNSDTADPDIDPHNKDDLNYTRTGWLTYQATGTICDDLQALNPSMSCGNAGSPSDLTRSAHAAWDPDYYAPGNGDWVNFPPVVGVLAGGQSPEESASLAYMAKQTWPLIDQGGSTYGQMIIEARIVAASGDNPPPAPFLGFPPDFNGDGYVNLDDYDHFEACGTGPALGPPAEGCLDADIDWDNDVDQNDFGLFQRCFSDGKPLDPGCLN